MAMRAQVERLLLNYETYWPHGRCVALPLVRAPIARIVPPIVGECT